MALWLGKDKTPALVIWGLSTDNFCHAYWIFCVKQTPHSPVIHDNMGQYLILELARPF